MRLTRSPSANHRSPSRRSCAGFTLIEAALTTVIVGTGVLAMVAAQQTYMQKNEWAQRTGLGMMLANELRELTLTLPRHDPMTGKETIGPDEGELTVADFDDVDDFAGTVVNGYGTGMTFGGTDAYPNPISALRQDIQDLPGWSQHIEVTNVFPDNISVIDDYTQPLTLDDCVMRVTVTVSYQSPQATAPMVITQLTWIVPN